MKKIRTIIVDDEEFAIIDLKDELSTYPDVELIATFSDGEEGLAGINELNPDLIFVDIEMPKLNGFEMLGRLECTPIVIFCTGYSKYAIDGYTYDPTDFLLKPVKRDRFKAAMERAFKDLERLELEERLNRQKQQVGYLLLEYRDLHGEAKKVCVWPEDLLYVTPQENNANYIEYHLNDESVHVVKKTLKVALEELESFGIMQVHRKYLINKARILEFNNNDTIVLKGVNQPNIPVSRGYRKAVKQQLQNL